MTTRMLIDARHPEETRVVVLKGPRLEEFDFEAEARKQIRGNIYLAKVTRVEPSLQAAFIDYGGNRHGFLPFSEIHPDYYQIPREDREALLREESRLAEEGAAAEANGNGDTGADPEESGDSEPDGDGNGSRVEDHGNTEDSGVEALRRQRMALRRRYKIQEVIKRRQVLLVQVVKEERGNKGAALTTYLSLAGRYSVLMPNTSHGGGISRKIANVADRKRLKAIMADLDLPPTMGAIVRTAGLERTKAEIRRDFDYLTRLWDEIRDTTLASTAPALIYEDSDLVKRAIRDLYTREVEEVLVDGEAAYKQARAYMKLLMPSHVKRVKAYADPVPLFLRAGVEGQLAAMMNPVVQLRSGGYLVLNPTEALVAVDVNSGRSTREYNIEETALKTNIEAAEEVARQLRLRDLAGLVVVDFIDMESTSNNRKVERALKEALKVDRARIQVGRISPFGLLEMSRQRLRTGVFEASTVTCPTCAGAGVIRTPASAALAALRLLEEEVVKGRASSFRLRADPEVAVYALNRKRADMVEIESRYNVGVEMVPDGSLTGARFEIDQSGPPPARAPQPAALAAPVADTEPEPEDADLEDDIDIDIDTEDEADTRARDEDRPKKRRRRRGGRNRRRDKGAQEAEAPAGDEEAPAPAGDEEAPAGDEKAPAPAEQPRPEPAEAAREAEAEGAEPPAKPRRRARKPKADAPAAEPTPVAAEVAREAASEVVPEEATPPAKPKRRARKPKADAPAAEPAPVPAEAETAAASEAEPEPANDPEPAVAVARTEPASPPVPEPVATTKAAAEPGGDPPATVEPRRGWWQRTFGN
jgi:ribonuclease E